MAGAGDVFGRCAKFHSDADFPDYLADADADQMGSEHAVGGCVRQDLNETVGLVICAGAAVRLERELAGLVGDASGLELFLGLTYPGDLRLGVHDAWDDVVVDVPRLARDDFSASHALVFGLDQNCARPDTTRTVSKTDIPKRTPRSVNGNPSLWTKRPLSQSQLLKNFALNEVNKKGAAHSGSAPFLDGGYLNEGKPRAVRRRL